MSTLLFVFTRAPVNHACERKKEKVVSAGNKLVLVFKHGREMRQGHGKRKTYKDGSHAHARADTHGRQSKSLVLALQDREERSNLTCTRASQS